MLVFKISFEYNYKLRTGGVAQRLEHTVHNRGVQGSNPCTATIKVKEIKLDPLENKVFDFIKKESLIEPSESILIGISGGSDSVALSNILFEISKFLNWKIFLAYVEHFVRKNTEIEKEIIKKFADERNLPYIFLEITKRSLKEKELREERYKVLENFAKENNIDKIATAHTLDDLIETIIMNFLRGMGNKGLIGIPIKRDKIVRPLIYVSKEEILSYCKRRNLSYHDDFTNLLPITLRNKIRWQMIPFLKDVSKHFPESILIQKKIAEEDEKFLNSILEEYMNSIKKGKNYFELELIKWENLSLSIKFRALNKIFKELGKNLTSKSLIKIIPLLDNAKEGFIGKIDFIELYKLKDKLLIKSQEKFEEYNFTLEIPGNLKLPSGEKIIAEVLDRESVKNINFQNPFQVYFDYDKINLDKLIIRTWKKGDRFKPFGLQGKSKKLQDFFVDKKIPRFQRNMIPLILGNNEILWIVGLARSDIAKIDENTKNILSIRVEREVKN